MTKSIKQELRGCHKDDVNPGFTMVMKLFRIAIKTSTIFFKIKTPLTTINASYRKFSTNIFKINVWHKDGINYLRTIHRPGLQNGRVQRKEISISRLVFSFNQVKACRALRDPE
jgi:hypothetical protein